MLSSRKDSTLMDFIIRDRGIEIHENKLSVGLNDELLAAAKNPQKLMHKFILFNV